MAKNVLFITADQWRADALGCAGHSVVETPHLDALAADGVRFAQHYAQAAPCGPSRASLLTGQYLMNHRSVLNGTPLDDRFTNVAREARSLGYDPTLFGYTDTSIDPRTVSDDDPRLRTYEGVLPGLTEGLVMTETYEPWFRFLAERGHVGLDSHASAFAPDLAFDATGKGSTWAPARFGIDESPTAFLTDAVLEWIGRQDQPWFAHVSYIRPHPPFRCARGYHDRFDPDAVDDPVRLPTVEEHARQHPFLGRALDIAFIRAPDTELDQRQWQATYHGMMSEVDDQLGRLFQHLRETGHWDDTLIVFTSDHGEQLGDQWFSGKFGFHDSSYRIPLIVRDPRAAADAGRGRVVDHFTESVDVMPTILEFLDTPEIPTQCDGHTLRAWLENSTPDTWRDAVFYEFDYRIPQYTTQPLTDRISEANLAVVRTATEKYVHFPTLPAVYYNLSTDPGELHNAADDPATHPAQLDLARRMLDWRLSCNEQTLSNTMLTPDGPFVAARS